MKITSMTNKDKGFYSLLGPFLANREVEREIGYKIYDDEGKIWFLAMEGKEVVGFCYRLEKAKGNFHIGSCYVVESQRQNGIFRQLLSSATFDVKGKIVMVTKNKHLMAMLINDGFTLEKSKGSFMEFRKEVV